jgi:hypothetical protein
MKNKFDLGKLVNEIFEIMLMPTPTITWKRESVKRVLKIAYINGQINALEKATTHD